MNTFPTLASHRRGVLWIQALCLLGLDTIHPKLPDASVLFEVVDPEDKVPRKALLIIRIDQYKYYAVEARVNAETSELFNPRYEMKRSPRNLTIPSKTVMDQIEQLFQS